MSGDAASPAAGPDPQTNEEARQELRNSGARIVPNRSAVAPLLLRQRTVPSSRSSKPAAGAARPHVVGAFPASVAGGRIVLPGRNCWHVERADRFTCVQDAADHFRWVRKALLGARRSIFILGWDLQTIDLVPQDAAAAASGRGLPEATGGPTRLDRILAHVARRRADVRAYILIWDYDALYTLERDPFLRWRLGWRMPRHVRFGFDDRHPYAACHHQKVVVVDDAIAFCGSIDLTTHRYDTCRHCCEEPLRTTPDGSAYGPYHEVGAMVSGPAAARLGELARERWRASQGDDGKLPPLAPGPATDLWPSDATPDLTHVEVAISRTLPEFESRAAVRECETLLLDAIGAAKRTLYIESQYFTSERIAHALAARLREPDGPEVLVVGPRECDGWLERNTMGAYRGAAFRRMAAADRHGRLRLLYPMASRSRDIPTFVHSKMLVADDSLLRIGSANLSRRSMGVDTECDLAVDGSRDERAREGIRRVRDRLIGEHLGLTGEQVAAGIARAGSLARFLDDRGGEDRTLVRIDPAGLEERPISEAVRAAADPEGPVDVETVLVPTARGSRVAAIAVAGLAVLSLFPTELLATAAGLLLGAGRGIRVAFAFALLLAVIGYAAGRRLGSAGLPRWMSRRAARSARQLGAKGVRGVIALRLAAIAGSGAVHLFCGARRVPFGEYLLGSAIALAPQVTALAGLGGLLRQAALQPSAGRALVALATVLLLILASAALRSLVLRRRYAPSLERHRSQAEFG